MPQTVSCLKFGHASMFALGCDHHESFLCRDILTKETRRVALLKEKYVSDLMKALSDQQKYKLQPAEVSVIITCLVTTYSMHTSCVVLTLFTFSEPTLPVTRSAVQSAADSPRDAGKDWNSRRCCQERAEDE